MSHEKHTRNVLELKHYQWYSSQITPAFLEKIDGFKLPSSRREEF